MTQTVARKTLPVVTDYAGNDYYSVHDLPAWKSGRLTVYRKKFLVNAVKKGVITLAELTKKYGVPAKEFDAWVEGMQDAGSKGLAAVYHLRGITPVLVQEVPKGIANVGNLCVDFDKKQVSIGGIILDLKGLQYKAVALLVIHVGELVSKKDFMAWMYPDVPYPPSVKIVDVTLCRLRKALEVYGVVKRIETVWGRGYIMHAT